MKRIPSPKCSSHSKRVWISLKIVVTTNCAGNASATDLEVQERLVCNELRDDEVQQFLGFARNFLNMCRASKLLLGRLCMLEAASHKT